MPDTSPSPSPAARADPALARLVRSLALSTRFRFYLAVVEAPGAARSLAALLEQGVFAVRESPVQVFHLDPYAAPAVPADPVPWRRLFDEVLAPLLDPASPLASPEAIVLADASLGPPADDGAWAVLFQRMNERRDLVASTLRGALVLALPPRLEPIFARAAPDFWSIRSLAVVLAAPPAA